MGGIGKNKTHGETNSPAYIAWRGMRRRCQDTGYKSYANYGGRGIKVCDRWNASYQAFVADVGPHPGPGYTIERIDNDGDYEPGNCRWATKAEQSQNRSICWTPEMDAKLRQMSAQGLNFTEMAAVLGKSKVSVQGRAYRIRIKSGVPPIPKKDRGDQTGPCAR